MIYADTKISKNNQTAIPPIIMKMLNLGSDDIVEWVLDDEGKVTLNLRKKLRFEKMRGSIDLGYKTNSVDLENEIYNF